MNSSVYSRIHHRLVFKKDRSDLIIVVHTSRLRLQTKHQSRGRREKDVGLAPAPGKEAASEASKEQAPFGRVRPSRAWYVGLPGECF